MGGLEQSVGSGGWGWQVMVMCSKAGSCPFSAAWGGACFKARLTEMLVGSPDPWAPSLQPLLGCGAVPAGLVQLNTAAL